VSPQSPLFLFLPPTPQCFNTSVTQVLRLAMPDGVPSVAATDCPDATEDGTAG
jgi:hypothetical protein